jgi:uncharacterized protein
VTRFPRRSAVVGLSLACLVGVLLLVDPRAAALGTIHVYQRRLSPIAADLGLRCRFTPTCSRYAEIAIARDGVVRGGWKTFKRLSRCGPWTPLGTVDAP